jgi:hypothetical protein
MDMGRAAALLGRRGGLAGGRKGGLARARRLAPARLREIGREAARVRWGGLPEKLRPLFWTHPSTFESLNLNDDRNLIFYQVLAYGDLEHRTWLVKRCGTDAVRAWLRQKRGGGLSAIRLAEWFQDSTIRRWQRGNPGAAIWENR